MVGVGMKLAMEKHSLLVSNQEMESASVQLVSVGMVLKNVMTLMSARRKKLASVLIAAAEIHGVAMNVLAVETFCTSRSMTLA
jgi:hypothetical protein